MKFFFVTPIMLSLRSFAYTTKNFNLITWKLFVLTLLRVRKHKKKFSYLKPSFRNEKRIFRAVGIYIYIYSFPFFSSYLIKSIVKSLSPPRVRMCVCAREREKKIKKFFMKRQRALLIIILIICNNFSK